MPVRPALALLLAGAGCAAAPTAARPRAWDFQLDEAGGPAAGFVVPGFPDGRPAGRWEVVRDDTAPSPKHALAQLATHHEAPAELLAVADTPRLADCRVRVALAPRADGPARGGGVVLRHRRPGTHYVLRWDVAASRVVLERVARGVRTELGRATVTVPDLGKLPWHTLTVAVRGARLAVAFDDVPVLDVIDDAALGPGQAGLWTPAGAVTAFDDLTLEALAPLE